MRDDFKVQTKKTLAERVAMHRSNPACRRVTSGPQENPEKAVNLGVAAHIAAASAGGARYDASMSPLQRSAIENGIWLCQSCAKLIDSDTQKYTSGLLRNWKTTAEANAATELEKVGKKQEQLFSADVELILFIANAPIVPLSKMSFDTKAQREILIGLSKIRSQQ